jgi:hypothetical protein
MYETDRRPFFNFCTEKPTLNVVVSIWFLFVLSTHRRSVQRGEEYTCHRGGKCLIVRYCYFIRALGGWLRKYKGDLTFIHFRDLLEFLNNLWGARNRVGMVVVPARQATQPGGIGCLESIHGLLKSLKIRALC